MLLADRLLGIVDTRLLLLTGLGLPALSMWLMTGWTPDVSIQTIIYIGFLQGTGLGMLFVPLTTVDFATLPATLRAESTGLFALSRNVGSCVGISIVTVLLAQNAQVNLAEIAAYIHPIQSGPRRLADQELSGPGGRIRSRNIGRNDHGASQLDHLGVVTSSHVFAADYQNPKDSGE